MTPEERQALREKHRDNGIDGRCETCHYITPALDGDFEICTAPPYPCDAIKVLDAWDASITNVAKAAEPFVKSALTHADATLNDVRDFWNVLDTTEPVSETDPKLSDCDHLDDYGNEFTTPGAWRPDYPFCPKCGEKL